MTMPSSLADAVGPATPLHTDAQAIHNLYQLSDRVYSGSQPDGNVAFGELQALGIATIITVDGATPDVERAKAHGMRYIHLPIGYDKVPDDKAVMLVQAMKQTEGKVFVHCHHGKHRGPAAAAVCVMADEGWANDKAIAWMKQAGTSDDYAGLYKSIEAFRVPDASVLSQPVALPEKSPIPALAGAMVLASERWEHLVESSKVRFGVPPDNPDVDPPHEAIQLAELFREMARTKESADKGEDFLTRLRLADAEATKLSNGLKAVKMNPSRANLKLANEALTQVGRSCRGCHLQYRN